MSVAHRRMALACLVVGSLVTAGCAGDSAAPLEDSASAEADALVKGRVVSDEIFPVADALVQAVGGQSTTTDEHGNFELAVAPGSVVLNVTAEGYLPLTEEVNVSPGGAVEVLLLLEGIAGAAPYAETLIFEGIIACGWAIVYGAGWYNFTPCPSGDNKDSFRVEVGAEWRAGVHEITWETSDEMLLASSLVGTCAGGADPDPCPGIVAGKDPLRILARPEDPEYAKQYAVDGQATWPEGKHESYILTAYNGMYRSEINQTLYPACSAVNGLIGSPPEWGCPFGVGVTFDLRYDVYHTTFYRDEPVNVETFTAIPDA